jgi:primosomal replication protein N
VNHLILHGAVIERKPLRYSPAGLPILEFVVEHLGTPESAPQRQVKLQVHAKAMGTVAEGLNQQALGVHWSLQGFLSPARQGKGLIFEVTRYQPI